jgi:hypothetical protein
MFSSHGPSIHPWLADDNDDIMMMAARIIKKQIAHQRL